jgi:hypothetical protein
MLLADDLKKNLVISAGLSGVYSSYLNKYILEIRNHNQTKSFRDEDEDVNGIAESSDIVHRLETIQRYGLENDDKEMVLKDGVFITPQLIGLITGRLKAFIDRPTLTRLTVQAAKDNLKGY